MVPLLCINVHFSFISFLIYLSRTNESDLTIKNRKSNPFKDKAYWITTWLRFKSGDRFAFEEIYSEFVDTLYSYGLKLTHDKELVKDSIQDLFIDLYRYKIDLKQPESFEFYLFKAFKRLIVNKLKRRSEFSNFENDEFVAFELKFNLEDEYIQNESEKLKLQTLQKALNRLEPQERELLFYKFNSKLTYKEIGKLLNETPDSVKKHVYRIISTIRKEFNSKFSLFLTLCCIA